MKEIDYYISHTQQGGGEHYAYCQTKKLIKRQPTIDAVPVVRCKDCKHYHKDEGWCDKHSHFVNSDGSACHPWESNDWKMFGDNDFCSGGERKNDADMQKGGAEDVK